MKYWEKLTTSGDIAAIKNIRLESDALKIKCLDEIDEYERVHQPVSEPPVTPVVSGKEPVNDVQTPTKVKTKRRKIFPSAMWLGQEHIRLRQSRILINSLLR